MGGARCSYQNCSQKSDNRKTHMFHYPVFDKVRCHQWITNAQKLNYLNLKVSQLKNRMVCEHHFTDDCFMNVMRNKLKHNAIPTESGPLCSKSIKNEEDEAQDINECELPINIDDIENEFTPSTDRKAHFSVKYGDFLTNDVTETITLRSDYKSTPSKLQDKGTIYNIYERQTRSSQNKQTSDNSNVKLTHFRMANSADNKKSTGESLKFENKLCDFKVVAIEFDGFNRNASEQNPSTPSESLLKPNSDQVVKINATSTPLPLSKKVRIISEKHISEPLKIPPGKRQPVSSSIIIKAPDRNKSSNIEIGQEIKTFYVEDKHDFQLTQNVHESVATTYTHAPRDLVTDQMSQNASDQPTTIVEQIELNDLAIQNTDSLRDTKLMDYLATEANHNSQHLEQEIGLFTNLDPKMPTIPNVEFVSCSSSGPSVFTLTNVPQVTTLVTDSCYGDGSQEAQNALLSMDSVMLATNPEHVSNEPAETANDALEVSNKIQLNAKENPTSKSTSPIKSMKRIKMPPEKVAAIEEKRKYNMKLKDIINSCLNNMDEESDDGKLTAAMKKELSNTKVGDHLSVDPSQQYSQENVIEYFKTRLQTLEDNLLNKIEQNSKQIIDLKKSFKNTPVKKSSSTQTYFSTEATKQNLYQQVSKYLSPDTNSLIYEELFINQCLTRTEPKRRKRRHNNNDKEI